MTQYPVLSVLLFLPLVGGVGALLLPRMAGWGWALLCALAALALAIAVTVQFDPAQPLFQFIESQPWIPGFGITYSLGVDGISIWLVGLNALLTVVALGASWHLVRQTDRPKQYLFLMMLLATGMQGVFLATNLFLFYVFWELMLVPAYLLVGMFGGPRRAYAAVKFVIYTAVGSLLMLVGIIATGFVVATGHLFPLPYDLDYTFLFRAGVPPDAQIILFLAFAAAFAVKAGLFPLHSWVPDTYSEAPVAVVVLVAGVMAKTGVYGLIRFCIPLFPQAARTLTPLMEILAVIGILYFAVQALVQTDFKRLLAYVSISHMSVIVLGLFAFNFQGVEGGILQMVNHGIVIAALFLVAGWMEARTGSRELGAYGGLAARVPLLATVFFIAALSALGLPGLNSFAGEFLAFLGVFHTSIVYGVLGTAVVVPAAWYMLRFFQGVTEGPAVTDGPVAVALGTASGIGASGAAAVGTSSETSPSATQPAITGTPARAKTAAKTSTRTFADLRWGEFLVILPLLALIFYLGAQPGQLTARMDTSVLTALCGAPSPQQFVCLVHLNTPAVRHVLPVAGQPLIIIKP
jgi:NADH-quinone oxidoreductase subunit M